MELNLGSIGKYNYLDARLKPPVNEWAAYGTD